MFHRRVAEHAEKEDFFVCREISTNKKPLSLFEAMDGRRPELFLANRCLPIGQKGEKPLRSPRLCGESSLCISKHPVNHYGEVVSSMDSVAAERGCRMLLSQSEGLTPFRESVFVKGSRAVRGRYERGACEQDR